MINSIELTLPESRYVKLDELRKGTIFMLARDFYSGKAINVYMVLKNEHTTTVTAVRLQDGETQIFGNGTHVVELTVTLHCKLHEPKDDLPF